MTSWIVLSAVSFCTLAVLHSYLGERLVIGPLLASGAAAHLPLRRGFAERTVRFAWHLTSVGWLGFAVVVMMGDVPAQLVVGGIAALSGLYVLVASRAEHLAYPVFGLAALGAAGAALDLGGARWAIGAVLGAILAAIAALHLYWAVGGRWGQGAVLPEIRGQRAFNPGPIACVLVAAGVAIAALVAMSAAGWVEAPLSSTWLRLGAISMAFVFLARTAGDFRVMGVSKKIRGTTFARWDDRLYTPLCFLLGSGFLVLAA